MSGSPPDGSGNHTVGLKGVPFGMRHEPPNMAILYAYDLVSEHHAGKALDLSLEQVDHHLGCLDAALLVIKTDRGDGASNCLQDGIVAKARDAGTSGTSGRAVVLADGLDGTSCHAIGRA